MDCIQRNNLRVSLIGFEPTLFEYSKVYFPEYYQDIGVPSRIQTYEFTQWEQIYSLPASFILHTDTYWICDISSNEMNLWTLSEVQAISQ